MRLKTVIITLLTMLTLTASAQEAPRDTFKVETDTTNEVYRLEQEAYRLAKEGNTKEAAPKLFRVMIDKDSVKAVVMKDLFDKAYERMQVKEKIEEEHHRQEKTKEMMLKIIATSFIILALILIFVTLNMQKMVAKLRQNNQELEDMQKQLEIANKEAKVSLKQKDEFIRHISHEVRTPLNIIGGFAQILSMVDGLPDEGMKEVNQKLTDSSKNITNIMKNITALSDMEQHKPIERTDRITCRELCEKAIEESEIKLCKKVKFDFQDPAPEGLSIKTNGAAVVSILTELLNNAQRFTTEGTIELTYSLPGHRLVFFTVTDSGTPIPEQEANHIFEAFVKLNDFDEGIGGGLTVARSQAKRMGGNVWLDTKYDKGNRFVLELSV